MTTPKQRIYSAAYRILSTTGEEQHRAFDRLCQLSTFAVALNIWLMTKPDPAIVDRLVSDVLLVSPMRSMIRS